MKKFTLLVAVLAISLVTFAQGKITYNLNGGVTNDYGWQDKQDMYEQLNADFNAFSKTEHIWASIDSLKGDVAGKGGITVCAGGTSGYPTMDKDFLQDFAFKAHFDWLVVYMDSMCTIDRKDLPSVKGGSVLRYNLAAFFLNSVRASWPKSPDYTLAGSIEYFQSTWKHGFCGPDSIFAGDTIVLPTPYKEGESFVGWYRTPDFSDEIVSVLTYNKEKEITLYAKFGEYIPCVKEVIAMENDSVTKVQGTVTYVAGKNFWIQDATAGILCYGANELKEGDLVVLAGKKTIYRGSPELALDSVVEKRDGKEVGAQTLLLSDIYADSVNGYATYCNELVYLEGVTISQYEDKGNYKTPYVTDGNNEIALYNWKDFTEDKYPVGTKVSLKAVLSIYNTTLQLRGKTEWIELKYILNAYANQDECYVEIQDNVGGDDNQVTLYAYSSSEDYLFKQWNDGNTDNPRTVTITCDTTFVAEFARSYYINAYSNNESWGTVTGGGTYLEGDTVTLIAKANEGFQLYYWVFGNTYPFEVTNDTLRLIVNGNGDIAAWFRYSPVVIDGINYYLDREYNYAYVLYLENYTGDIVIPSSVVYKDKTYGVGGIYEDAFAGTSITSLTVSNGLNGIDLSGCDSLVALSGNIGFIGACRGLNSLKELKEVYITSGTLATGNVRNFNFLNLLQIPTLEVLDLSKVENTELSPEMFKETYLEDVYDYYYGYVDRVHLSLKNLRKLVLPEGLTKIHERQFESLWMLEEIVIPDGVTDIPDGAFYDCHALANIEFSKNLTSIGKYAFYSCHALENIVIPEGVTEIGDAAFYGCNYADEIVIASSVKRIGNNAFALCNQVERMEVRATIPPSIKAKTFYQVNRNIEFVVPVEARNAYAEDIYWREFIQKAPTDIDATNTDSFVVYTQGGMLYIEGVETDYSVFDASGRLVYTGRDAQLQLPRGVYMIAIDGKVEKIVL